MRVFGSAARCQNSLVIGKFTGADAKTGRSSPTSSPINPSHTPPSARIPCATDQGVNSKVQGSRLDPEGPSGTNYAPVLDQPFLFPDFLRHGKIMGPAVSVSSNSPPPLTDEEWKLASAILLGSATRGGRPYINSRRSLEGMRWVASTGKPWVDMPEEFGNTATVRRQYARLKQRGVIDELLTAFPNRSAENDSSKIARLTVGFKLACLRNLLERRARGRAAQTAKRKTGGILSPIGD